MVKRIGKFFCEYTGIPEYWLKSTLFELRMAIIRAYGFLPFHAIKEKNILSQKNQINILFGCGDTKYEGWWGVDCFWASHVDFVLDLRRKLPFQSESVDLCYSEHFMEHLTQKEAVAHLSEVYRVLKTGGRYRIVVPAAFRFIDRYIQQDSNFFALAFPWAERNMDAVKDILYFSGEHKNVYDFSEFTFLSSIVGFSTAIESAANSSEIKKLNIDKSNPQRVAESLYVEMIK